MKLLSKVLLRIIPMILLSGFVFSADVTNVFGTVLAKKVLIGTASNNIDVLTLIGTVQTNLNNGLTSSSNYANSVGTTVSNALNASLGSGLTASSNYTDSVGSTVSNALNASKVATNDARYLASITNAQSNVTLGSNLTVNGNTTISGNAYAQSNLVVNGSISNGNYLIAQSGLLYSGGSLVSTSTVVSITNTSSQAGLVSGGGNTFGIGTNIPTAYQVGAVATNDLRYLAAITNYQPLVTLGSNFVVRGSALVSSNLTIGVGYVTNDQSVRLLCSANSALPADLSLLTDHPFIFQGADGHRARLILDCYVNGQGGSAVPALTFRSANGTATNPTATVLNDTLLNLSYQGYGATTRPTTTKALITVQATTNWTDTSQPAYTTLYTCPTNNGNTTVSRQRWYEDGGIELGGSAYMGATSPGAGVVWINGPLQVSGAITSGGSMVLTNAQPNVILGSNLTVNGDVTISGNTYAQSNLIVNGIISNGGLKIAQGGLLYSGGSLVSTSTVVSITNTVNQAGLVSGGGNTFGIGTNIPTAAQVGAVSTNDPRYLASLTNASAFDINGAAATVQTNLNNGLTASSNYTDSVGSTVSNALNASKVSTNDARYLASITNAQSNVTLGSNLTVNGNTTINGDTTIAGSLYVTNVVVTNVVQIYSNLSVNGSISNGNYLIAQSGLLYSGGSLVSTSTVVSIANTASQAGLISGGGNTFGIGTNIPTAAQVGAVSTNDVRYLASLTNASAFDINGTAATVQTNLNNGLTASSNYTDSVGSTVSNALNASKVSTNDARYLASITNAQSNVILGSNLTVNGDVTISGNTYAQSNLIVNGIISNGGFQVAQSGFLYSGGNAVLTNGNPTTFFIGPPPTNSGVVFSANANTNPPSDMSLLNSHPFIFTGADGQISRMIIDSYANGAGGASVPALTFRSAEGTAANPTSTLSLATLINIGYQGFGATTRPANTKAAMLVEAPYAWSDVSQPARISFLTAVSNGVGTFVRMRLHDDGGIQMGGPDGNITATSPGQGVVSINGPLRVAGSISNNGMLIAQSGLLYSGGNLVSTSGLVTIVNVAQQAGKVSQIGTSSTDFGIGTNLPTPVQIGAVSTNDPRYLAVLTNVVNSSSVAGVASTTNGVIYIGTNLPTILATVGLDSVSYSPIDTLLFTATNGAVVGVASGYPLGKTIKLVIGLTNNTTSPFVATNDARYLTTLTNAQPNIIVGSNLTINGNATINGDTTIAGSLYVTNVVVTNIVQIYSNLSVNGIISNGGLQIAQSGLLYSGGNLVSTSTVVSITNTANQAGLISGGGNTFGIGTNIPTTAQVGANLQSVLSVGNMATTSIFLTNSANVMVIGATNTTFAKFYVKGDNGILTNVPLVVIEGSTGRNNDFLQINGQGGTVTNLRVDMFGNLTVAGNVTASNITAMSITQATVTAVQITNSLAVSGIRGPNILMTDTTNNLTIDIGAPYGYASSAYQCYSATGTVSLVLSTNWATTYKSSMVNVSVSFAGATGIILPTNIKTNAGFTAYTTGQTNLFILTKVPGSTNALLGSLLMP